MKSKNLEIDKLKNSSNTKLTDNFNDMINDFNTWLSSITFEQNIALINLFVVGLIMLTLISLIFIFYGNYLLDYLKLEERYPKIVNIIKLRYKYQQFYLFINFIIITAVSVIMVVMNLIML